MLPTATLERSTSVGTRIRVTLAPLPGGRVRIVEYYRKPRHASQFKRAKGEEGAVLPFEQLGVDEDYDAFFGLEEAA